MSIRTRIRRLEQSKGKTLRVLFEPYAEEELAMRPAQRGEVVIIISEEDRDL